MERFVKLIGLVLAVALVAAACGGGETADEDAADTTPTGELPVFAGACTPEEPDCEDTVVAGEEEPLFIGDEPRGDDVTGTPITPMPANGGLTVSEAMTTDATGILAVRGFVVWDATGIRLCEALAESFPPQCGGASVPMPDVSGFDESELASSGEVQWSDDWVVILGEIIDGVLVPAADVAS